MQLFLCSNCNNPVYFENTKCVNCDALLGFDASNMQMLSLEQKGLVLQGFCRGKTSIQSYKYCKNQQIHVCNWLISSEDSSDYCMSCELNDVIPNITHPDYYKRWVKLEEAKHRLIYSLLKLKLPVFSKLKDPVNGLAFAFESNGEKSDDKVVLTGHLNGLITMNISEADDVEREMAKQQMAEVYRTVLGHFRHEIAHYYWFLLIARDKKLLAKFREIFGDERQNYQEALKVHYQKINSFDWQNNYISNYASSHPWEDWAETWAHYLHIVDTLETANSFGVSINPSIGNDDVMDAEIDFNAYNLKDFRKTFDEWLPVTFMMNSLNKSMGLNELYPFIINENVYKKLSFIHGVIHENTWH